MDIKPVRRSSAVVGSRASQSSVRLDSDRMAAELSADLERYAAPPSRTAARPTPKATAHKYTGRFFFTISASEREQLEARKRIIARKTIAPPVNKELLERQATYKKTLPPVLSSNIDRVREFWLEELAPLTLASDAGMSGAQEVVQRTLGHDVVLPRNAFSERLHRAIELRMLRFIRDYAELTPEEYAQLIEDIKPPAPPPLVLQPKFESPKVDAHFHTPQPKVIVRES